ncbi:MAG: hypothetical protein HYU97_02715 [Deltaproteobacteria bacterium]|nr:hypothetical protein [Deltaproteobacteria bacterium]
MKMRAVRMDLDGKAQYQVFHDDKLLIAFDGNGNGKIEKFETIMESLGAGQFRTANQYREQINKFVEDYSKKKVSIVAKKVSDQIKKSKAQGTELDVNHCDRSNTSNFGIQYVGENYEVLELNNDAKTDYAIFMVDGVKYTIGESVLYSEPYHQRKVCHDIFRDKKTDKAVAGILAKFDILMHKVEVPSRTP